ncbi:SpoIIE family protein phosphatase [Solidesulfovibrio carbinolicus]|uniref:Phosphatase n=1 Tax=Solidesulfovibrio carbinolicus TaxID=296842 RepID=A0A4P6HPI8_9BACT|nr:SpoIIE family protein phosphatase [Solidesulfovibrio carbinolicus]QAZ68676.1 phosphatase [Solidesulfovibrio carbinolicus]
MSPSLDVRPTRGLAFKLAVCILTSATIIFTAAFAYYYRSSKDMLLAAVRDNAQNLLRRAVSRLEAPLSAIERVPQFMALKLGQELPAPADLDRDLTDFLTANPDVFGAAAAFEPGVFHGLPRYSPYFCRKGEAVAQVGLGYEEYYELQNWYLVPKVLQKAVWSEPYFDESGGDIVMTTYSVPVMGQTPAGPAFLGVVTADVALDWLRKQVGRISLYNSGYAFLLSRSGVLLSHPDNRLVMRESIFSRAEQFGSAELRALGRRMIAGEEGFARLPDFILGKPAWVAFAPMRLTGWSMGVIVPEDELFAPLRKLGREVAILGGAGFTALLLVIAAIAAHITRPLSRLAATAAEIAHGNLDAPVPLAAGRDEVGALSRSFEQMRLALRDYIADLTATTKAKERLESELKIARNIQMSFLPKRFPPFPEITSFALHADLLPAREVGGDLYDFFLLGPGRLLFLVGDVSGKGVPAALFMAVTKTLIKGNAEQESDPAEILAKVNRELCVDNESMLFVTMFLAILDCDTGEMTFSNAGHNPPARLAPDGTVSWLALPRGLFLGVMEDAVYRTATVTLAPGEKIVAFTDGVTEAQNPAQELFGTDRLLTVLSKAASMPPEVLDAAVMQAATEYAEDAEQADDITVLTLLYRGSDPA